VLISVVADSLYIRLVFRARGGATDVVRAVDITWTEAEELRLALTRTLYQDAERPAEQHRRRHLSRGEDQRE
jgi:hypothetical protein